eukprot:TRINITY_DN5376_c0_g1_i1.p1 TRINITY_DN5376_c0_g1~~TRINITY_DN5376_c0_g1_i1.p1  ORF type:complete len:351 (-),score=55.89 TRINITY_DN5376_c0_g1_i1:120-1172(-)
MFNWFFKEREYHKFILQLLKMYMSQPEVDMEIIWDIVLLSDEFAYNRNSRIQFTTGSADGIILFHYHAQVLSMLSQFVTTTNGRGIDQDDVMKTVQIFIKSTTRLISGAYTPYGVFELYKDTVVDTLVKSALDVVFSIDYSSLEMYQKLEKNLFKMLKLIISELFIFVSQIPDAHSIERIINILLIGLHSKETTVLDDAFESVDTVMSLSIKEPSKRPTPTELQFIQISQMILSNHHLMMNLLVQSFYLLFIHESIASSVSKPLLSIMFKAEPVLLEFKQSLLNGHPEQHRQTIMEAFDQLTRKIEVGKYSVLNQDHLSTNLVSFRTKTRQIIDLHLLYRVSVRYSGDSR